MKGQVILADVTKLKKQFQKLQEQADARRAELNASADAFAVANRALGAVEEQLEHAQALADAELRIYLRGYPCTGTTTV